MLDLMHWFGEFFGELGTKLKADKSYQDKLSAEKHDIKLKADFWLEEQIIKVIRQHSDFKILSEETLNQTQVPPNEFVWILDPLDGSFNFRIGFPYYAISLALWRGLTEPVAGVIYDLSSGDYYYTDAKNQAWRNQKRLQVSSADVLEQAVIATGFPANFAFDENFATYLNFMKSFKKVRMIGSAALALAHVAAGVFDAYYERNTLLWDVAAGLALVKQAGGQYVLKERGGHRYDVCAAAPGIFSQLKI